LEQFTLTYPDIIIEPLITPQVVRMNDGVADIAGVGIALVDQALISDDLRQRRLRVLLDTPVSGLGAYYLVMPKSKTSDPKTIVFGDWLISEAARDTC
jgi:DNA-binding transcriptional LysR family regulator